MSVVEPSPGSDPTPETGELHYRLHQQSILADFGVEALRTRDLAPMLERAVNLCAQGMRARFAKFMQYRRDHDTLLVSNGVGWHDGVIGVVEIANDLGSPAGFAFHTGEAVISNHLENEQRFRTPAFMVEHGIRRAINVLVEASGKRFGVLEVDSPDDGQFEAADLAFMRGFANLIGVAIERQQAEARLNAAIEHQELLTREASHRVKNSLALVSAMLSLQMRGSDDPEIARMLGDAQARIVAIGKTHDRLWRGARVGVVTLDELLCSVVDELIEQAPGCRVDCDVPAIEISADTAIPMALLVTELITNAIKYAYGESGGPILVRMVIAGDRFRLSVEDRGVGMTAGFVFDAGGRNSLGMRMIGSLAKQLGGTISFADAAPGTRVTLDMPDPR